MGVGIDVGTGNIISARKGKTKDHLKRQRNAFIDVGKFADVKNNLTRTKIEYAQLGDEAYILGDNAYEYANIFGTAELKRPMESGLLNPKEKDAHNIIRAIIGNLLGAPSRKNEVCVYVVPSEPINVDHHVNYHENIIHAIIEQLGFTPIKIREAVALAYEGLADEGLTGICVSLGAGMSNVAIMYQGLTTLDFSVTRSGDYVDLHAHKETNTPIAQITSIKESPGFSLIKSYDDRESLAIQSYYRYIIKNIIVQISELFKISKNIPKFPKPVKMVCGGGTSMVEGFIDVVKDELNNVDFPINISDVILVEEPLYAIARGALSEAILEEEDRFPKKVTEKVPAFSTKEGIEKVANKHAADSIACEDIVIDPEKIKEAEKIVEKLKSSKDV